MAGLSSIVDPIRQAVREEVKSVLDYELRMVRTGFFSRASMTIC